MLLKVTKYLGNTYFIILVENIKRIIIQKGCEFMDYTLPIKVNADLTEVIDVGLALQRIRNYSINTNDSAQVIEINGNNAFTSDLKLEKSTCVCAAKVGEKIPYTIRVSNNGPNIANNIVVVDEIEKGLEISLKEVSLGDIEQNENSIVWTIPQLDVGEQILATVVLIPTIMATDKFLLTKATLTSDNILENPANAVDTMTIYVEKYSDLILNKNICRCVIDREEGLIYMPYKLKVKNNGPNIASNIMIIDFIPKDFKVVYFQGTKGNIVNPNNKLIWKIPILRVGEEVEALCRVNITDENSYIESKTIATSDDTFINPINASITTHINFIKGDYK